MADVITRLKLESGEYDSKIKRATQGLLQMEQECRKVGGTLGVLEKDQKQFVQSLGSMQTVSTSVRGKIGELSGAFVELRSQYNRLTDEEKKGDFGRALSASLDQLKQRVAEAKRELSDITKELDGSGSVGGGGFLSGMGGKMSGALQVFAGNMLTKAAGAVANLGAEMADMVQQGIEMAKQGEGIRIAFERLGRGDILDGLREATHGTVTDIELMKAAVKFNDFKLPLEELGTMLAFAQQKAKDTGQSVDYMVDSIVTGLGRKSLMILDNLGLSAAEIKDKMAETGDMTKAVGAIIREQMAKAGDYVETAADRAAQANVSLQNKMEELGRKFAPLEEASNTFWTSVKISILDVVGGPLADFLNGLTEAGRRMGMLKQMNGGGDGGNTKVENQLSALRGSNYKNAKYNSQIAQYDQDIRDAERLRKKYQDTGWAGGGLVLSEISRRFNVKIGGKEDIDNLISSLKTMRSEYVQGAKEIMKPVETNVKTDESEQSVTSLTKKLKDLQEQRKKAIAAGDTELSGKLLKQINQTKADIKGLGGTTTIPRTTATPKTEEQKNSARIAELVKQYQDLATAAKTADDAQKAGITERMAKIQGEIKTLEARNSELKKFADEARQVQFPVGSLPQLNEQLKTLQAEQAKALDAKQWKDYQQQIEQTQYQIDALKGKWKDGLQATFKLNIKQQGSTDINTAKPDDIAVTFKADDADVLAKVRDIEGVTIDDKTMSVTANTAEAYNQVEQLLKSVDGKTVTFTVQPKMETGISITNDVGMSAYIASIKQQLETADYGTSLYKGLSAQLTDMTTLQNLVGESLKAGLGTAMFDAADATGKDFWTRAMEGSVENIDWQPIIDKINEKLKEMNMDPIAINFETGGVKNQANDMAKDWKSAASAIQSVGQAMSQIEDPAAKVMGTIAQAIATIALTFAESLKGTFTPWDWIAGAAAGTATMISTIAAIKSATKGGFAEGGIVPGNSYSGDNLRISDYGINSGELVLSRAQTNSIAAQLEGGMRNIELTSVVRGEDIVLAINNRSRRMWRGEYVTSKKL